MTSNVYDVVVVGGRVAGASTAMLLARAGVRVALVDRSAYGTDVLSTHGLMRAGVLQLSRWGLLPEIVAAGTPPIRQTTFHYTDAHPVTISIRPYAGVGSLYAPRRFLLDRVLVDAAARAGAEVFHESRMTEPWRDHTGRVAGIRVIGALGRRDLSARFVVGADGVSSPMARWVGAPVLRNGRWGSACHYAYFSDIDASGYEWAYGSGAAAGIIPTNDRLSCVFVATSPDRMRSVRATRSGDEAFDHVLGLASPRFRERVRESVRVGRQHGWAGRPGFVRRAAGSGWALVGDAGYYKDPISTHGMTDAMRDAELLANALVDALAGARSEAIALDLYQQQRDMLSGPLFDVSDDIASYAWGQHEVKDLLRRLAAAMVDEVELLAALPAPRTPVDEVVRG